MKKAKSMFVVMLAAAVLTACCLAFAACGGVDGEYKVTMTNLDYLAEEQVKTFYETPENAVLSMVQAQMIEKFCAPGAEDAYSVTLSLEDGSYTLRKAFHMGDNYKNSYGIDMTFSGTYTAEDASVTLSVPSSVLVTQYQHGPQAASFMPDIKDKTYTENNEESAQFFNMFDTMYLIESADCTEMTVTVDSENGTFSA